MIQDGRVVLGCRDGKVYAFDAASGKPVWSVPCGGPVVASPASDGKHLYAAGGNGRLLCLDAATGKPGWTLDLAAQTAPDVQLFSSPALARGKLYIGTSKGKFFCIGK
jgi:outer membrane protein assembly factor BamB